MRGGIDGPVHRHPEIVAHGAAAAALFAACAPMREADSFPILPTTMSFLAEIKRRKVFHVAVAYAIAAWLLVQVVVAIEAPLNLPAWFDTATIVLLAVGFPLALILSWAFDWTPAGVVRDTGGRMAPTGAAPAALPDGNDAVSDAPAEARSLERLIAEGPISMSRLMSLAIRTADALASAHEKGMVHGSLRPASILVRDDDQVELVSFGLADPGLRNDPSWTAYMAPERARGELPDSRSDQFSFGAVLYEMATRHRAFAGAKEVDMLAAVLQLDPEPVSRINPEIPMPLQWAIERCLSKEPRERYASTRDLCTDLASIAQTVRAATSARFASTHNLPAPRTPLIGRERELSDIKELVLEGDARLVTLTGAGGIGKTRLLIELGRQLLGSFKGGVFYTPLDRVQDAELVASEIMKSLSAQQIADSAEADVLRRHLRHHCVARTLLLIDNFEHVLEAAGLLSDLLAASEQLGIVVTSRAALRIYGEHEFRVAPLDVARESSGGAALEESPAVRLFLDRALPRHGDVDDEGLKTVAEICERLDGLPLAIELAAARTKVLSLPALLVAVRDPLRVLSGGPRDSPARQQTLRATLEWSYNLLDEDHQKLFRRLGVFVGGATLEAIEAVCNVDSDLGIDLLSGVESLVDNSLLRQMESDDVEPRFTMFQTMREYVIGRLAEAGEEARIRRAHAAYCIVLAEESLYATGEAQRELQFGRLDRELGNLRSALDWLAAARDAEWGLRLANSLGPFWIRRSRCTEGYERTTKFLPLSEAAGDSELLVWGLVWAADLAANCTRPAESIQHHVDSLEMAKRLGVVPAILRGLNGIAVQTQQAGDFDRAMGYHEEAVKIAREAGGSVALIGGMLSNYADCAKLRGDYERAQGLLEETAQMFLESGDEAGLAWSLNHQGDIARKRRDFETARRLYEQSLSKFRSLSDRSGTAACLYDLAGIAADTGDFATAERLNGEALSLYWGASRMSDLPRVLEALTGCAVQSGDYERALTLAGSAAALRQTLSLQIQEATRAELERKLDAARQKMSGGEAAEKWMAGWGMQPDRAVAFALETEPASSNAL